MQTFLASSNILAYIPPTHKDLVYQATVEDYFSDSEEDGLKTKVSSGEPVDDRSRRSQPSSPSIPNEDVKSHSARSADSGYQTDSQQSASVDEQLLSTQRPPIMTQDSRRRPPHARRPTISQVPLRRKSSNNVVVCTVPGCTQCGSDAIEPRPRQSRRQSMLYSSSFERAPEVSYPPSHDERSQRSAPVYYRPSSPTNIRPSRGYHSQGGPMVQPATSRRLSKDTRPVRPTSYHERSLDSYEPQSINNQGSRPPHSWAAPPQDFYGYPQYPPIPPHVHGLQPSSLRIRHEEDGSWSESESDSETDDEPTSVSRARNSPKSSLPHLKRQPNIHTVPSVQLHPQTVVYGRRTTRYNEEPNHNTRPLRRVSASRPPLIPSIKSQSTYPTPRAQIIVEGTRSSRRQRTQAYDIAHRENRYSQSASSEMRDGSDKHVSVKANNEVRSRKGSDRPGTVHINRDCEDRAVPPVPTQGRMKDLVINSSGRSASPYHNARETVRGDHSTPARARRDAEERSEMTGNLSRRRRDLHDRAGASQSLPLRERGTTVIQNSSARIASLPAGSNREHTEPIEEPSRIEQTKTFRDITSYHPGVDSAPIKQPLFESKPATTRHLKLEGKELLASDMRTSKEDSLFEKTENSLRGGEQVPRTIEDLHTDANGEDRTIPSVTNGQGRKSSDVEQILSEPITAAIAADPWGSRVFQKHPISPNKPSSVPDNIEEGHKEASSLHYDPDYDLAKTAALMSGDDYCNDSDDGNESSIPSYAASVFTVESLASSASALSNRTDYSVLQIATATRRLVTIVSEDELLTPLYQSAIDNPDIGPVRLQRNLRRFFKTYADNLEEEGEGRIEFLASRLVANKARYLAECIVEKFRPRLSRLQACHREQQDESSDEEEKASTVNENVFADLKVFGEFLAGSVAFSTLRAQIQSFVLPKTVLSNLKTETMTRGRRQNNDEPVKALSWGKWLHDARRIVDAAFLDPKDVFLGKRALFLAVDAFCLATDPLFVQLGQLEPPLGREMTRIRWICKCGDVYYSDVKEYRENGVSELITNMERSTGIKVSSTTYNSRTGNQRYIAPQPVQWVKNGCKKLWSSLPVSSRSVPGLPQHNSQTSVAGACTSTDPSTTLQSGLHLMACMHQNRSRKVLQQDRLENISTDRELLSFLRRQYVRHRGQIMTTLSFKSVKGIFFVKFNLPMGNTVIVRDHDPYCVATTTSPSSCECIPPESKVEPSPNAEYRCVPGPPATYPPVPSEHLLMLFTCPSYAHKDDDWILKQLPKRTCGELQGKAGQPAEGWGIYYKEGWDRDMITLAVFVVFLIASLLFGVLWSAYKFDVQGAFGVAAYMVAVCAIVVPLIAMRAEKMG